MELSNSNIKKKLLYFQKWNPALSTPKPEKKPKKFTPKKVPYISGNGTFLL